MYLIVFWYFSTMDHVMYWKFVIKIEVPIIKVIQKILSIVHPEPILQTYENE